MISPIESYINEEPTQELLIELAKFDASDLMELIERLEEGSQRAHLEALGADKGIPKAVRKTAKKAAYRLKSKGVSGEWRPAKTFALDTGEQDLSAVGAMTMPGLHGYWMMTLRGLGDQRSVVGRCEAGSVIEANVADDLSMSRIRKLVKRDHARTGTARLVLVNGDLAVRTIARIEEELALAEETPPTGWRAIAWWRDEAVARGADGARADSRTMLADELAAITLDVQRTTLALFGSPGVTTPFIAPEQVYQRLEQQLHDACHSPIELDEAAFRQRVDAIQSDVADGWLADPVMRKLLGSWMDGNADFLFAAGRHAEAVQCLWLADEVRDVERKPSELEFYRDVIGLAVDFGMAWGVYQEIKANAGADHDGHDHGHDHDGHHHHPHGRLVVDPSAAR